jgi:triosephosphate isomerase (TIM)
MSQRKPIIAGNWKMYKTVAAATATVLDLKPRVSNATHCEVVVAPPFTAIKAVADRLEGSAVKVAGQDVAAEGPEGAYTGEVSAEMLADAGCAYVIIGHSERRQYYAETDETIARKARRALAARLIPIVCVGETLAQREAGKENATVEAQICAGLSLTATEASHIVVAYEPVWAIGTGRAATPEIAQTMHSFIRKTVGSLFDNAIAANLRILYGGSVKPENIAEFMREPDVDGALVGGASLEAEPFAKIVFYNRA